MTEEEYEKKVKWTGIFCLIVGILLSISMLAAFLQQMYSTAGTAIGLLILLFLFYILSKKKNIIGPIIGILLAVLYILQLNIMGIIIGILILVDCISMIKYIKEQ